MAISFDYQVQKFLLPRQKKIVKWILLVAFLERREVDEISYIFCESAYLLKLNRRFLHHSTYTDIITFDYSVKGKLSAEIYISIARVRENASEFKTTFTRELRRVMIHGVLHCIGYSDKTNRTTRIMRRKEEEYLTLFEAME
ncbi:MAG: rRNA maturation RNase YbeY [Chitinophagales bacterium]